MSLVLNEVVPTIVPCVEAFNLTWKVVEPPGGTEVAANPGLTEAKPFVSPKLLISVPTTFKSLNSRCDWPVFCTVIVCRRLAPRRVVPTFTDRLGSSSTGVTLSNTATAGAGTMRIASATTRSLPLPGLVKLALSVTVSTPPTTLTTPRFCQATLASTNE